MKNVLKAFGIIALVAVIGFSMASCATTTIGGASGGHGLISGLFSPNEVTKDAQKIESYLIILGLIDVGFDKYATAVRKADASNKKITSVSRDFFGIVTIITAYTK